MTIKTRDRVKHSFLGDGTVVERTELDCLVMVRYDNDPPVEYNMGENPTAELVSELEIIK